MDVKNASIVIKTEILITLTDVEEDMANEDGWWQFQPETISFVLTNGTLEDYEDIEITGRRRLESGGLGSITTRHFHRYGNGMWLREVPEWVRTVVANAEKTAEERGWSL